MKFTAVKLRLFFLFKINIKGTKEHCYDKKKHHHFFLAALNDSEAQMKALASPFKDNLI